MIVDRVQRSPRPGMNPRYLEYCAAHDRTPDAMLAHDRERYPGGRMCGFILWMHGQWATWHAERGLRRHEHVLSDQDHVDFDAWLSRRGGR